MTGEDSLSFIQRKPFSSEPIIRWFPWSTTNRCRSPSRIIPVGWKSSIVNFADPFPATELDFFILGYVEILDRHSKIHKIAWKRRNAVTENPIYANQPFATPIIVEGRVSIAE